MTKFVMLERDEITDSLRGGNTEIEFGDNQAFLRVNPNNEDQLRNYKKYSLEEMREINFEDTVHKLQSKTTQPQKLNPFGSKYHEDGSKLYENLVGVAVEFSGNETKAIRMQIPFKRCFLTEIEIINASTMSKADFFFEVSDGQGGFVPVYKHGYQVNISESLYRRKSSYEAELSDQLYINCVLTNKDDQVREIGLNLVLHATKD